MFKNIFSLVSVVLALTTSAQATRNVYDTTADGVGCTAGLKSYSTGFNARFFDYCGGDLIKFNDNGYVADDYALGQIRTSTSGVTEPNFNFGNGIGGKHIYSMYNIDMWNVLIELKGYFVAPETGLYKVTIQKANDGAFIWLGDGAFSCCSQDSNQNSFDQVLVAARGSDTYSSYIHLDAGMFYPMRTTYINIYFGAVFQFEVVTPSGRVINNFDDTVINFDKSDIEACAHVNYGQKVSVSTNIVYGSSYTTASTQWNQVIDANTSTGLVENIYYPEATGTITTTITNSFAATTTITSIKTDGDAETPVVVVVDQVSVEESLLQGTKPIAVTATVTGKTVPFATGCEIDTAVATVNPGFHATLFKYDGCFGFLEPTYYANQYTTELTIGTAHNITSPNFSVHAILGQTNTIYGAKLDSWKGYVAQLTGYIYAQESGLYQFSIDYSDDGSMVWIGTNDAFSCCQPDVIPYNSDEGALFFAKDEEAVNGYVHLNKGYYYPIRVVLVNWYGDSVLNMSMVTPNGEYIADDWSKWIISAEEANNEVCSA